MGNLNFPVVSSPGGIRTKLIRSLTRREPREYWKHLVAIRNDIVEQAGWCPNQELGGRVVGKGRVVLYSVADQPKMNRVSYPKVREFVREALQSSPRATTWSEIREKFPSLPKRPVALWVRMLDRDIGLCRSLESKTSRMLRTIVSEPQNSPTLEL